MVLALPLSGRGCLTGGKSPRPTSRALASCRPSRRQQAPQPTVAQAAAFPMPGFNSPADRFHAPSSQGLFGAFLPHVEQQSTGMRQPGDFCSNYRKGQQLGQGSFGTVFRGEDLNTGSEVAIKAMPKQRGKLNQAGTMEKICAEVDFMERLQGSRGVVDLQDCFEEADEVLVVTELCLGGDLQRLSDTHAVISERCLALIAIEVLKVIQACNRQGIIHGDIKPANFVLKHPHRNPLFSMEPALAAASWLKAIDFGCSQELPEDGASLFKRAGTPAYMAPEVFARDYGMEADVWSAGILLYQVFCKRFPFWDTYEAARACRVDDIATAVCTSDVRMAFGPWLNMSAEGRAFIQGLLTRDPADRLTVSEALSHPWLAQATSTAPAAPPPVRCGNNIVRSPAVVRVSHPRVGASVAAAAA